MRLETLSHHVAMLVDFGVLRLARTHPSRGALAHVYEVDDGGPGCAAPVLTSREIDRGALDELMTAFALSLGAAPAPARRVRVTWLIESLDS